ncbi:receptor-like protein kinase FERONIA [Impatiens glandulifera]|uniref:receptor-like protein kinase FERONIA n=1 Tax=Impatiens glandulifera TaxID=253017 RepID=UPI001FB053B5|nr:receptor-like protein kinase FERONIA [Impatiens glandulifera]
METVHRLNIGGTFISPAQDTGMFREWSNDFDYLLEPNQLIPLLTTVRIRFSKIPDYIAPQKIYQSSWSMDQIQYRHVNTCCFTWKLPVDAGFSYLVRLHFCELDYETKEIGEKTFKILINNQTVESNGDLIKWGVEIGVAFYRDYIVSRMVNRDLFISLCPHRNQRNDMLDAVLKGLEVLKLSNDDQNLAGETITVEATSFVGWDFSFFKKLAATILAIIIVIGIIFNKLVFWRGRFGDNRHISLISFPPTKINEETETCKIFTLNEIRKATSNFSENMLIRGNKNCNIYKGLIRNDKTNMVTVKRFIPSETKQGANHEFTTEIEILSKLRHKHLIKLIGYCSDRNEKVLVYEHMAKGSLADHVYMSREIENDLKWDQKLNICLGAARGLDYLHTGTQHSIIHRDVKSSSILLDGNYVAKIADFGFCKMSATTNDTFTGISTDLKGTNGYLDPEYFFTRWLTKKSDVYAFGVVLWEVLCGRPALNTRIKEQRNLAQWAQRCFKEGKVEDIVDPTLKSQISPACLKMFVAVANVCSHSVPTERPSMADVVASLERAADLQRRGGNVSDDEVDRLTNVTKNNRSFKLTLSQDEVDALYKYFKLDENGPYTLDELCNHLKAYKAFKNSVPDKRIAERFGDRVRESLIGFQNDIESGKVHLENNPDEIHPLAKIVMDYMKNISHYNETINTLLINDKNIEEDNNPEINPTKSHFNSLVSSLERVLQDVSTDVNKEESHMNIFFMNNINYMAQEVKESSELTTILGDDWVRNRKRKVEYHKFEYEKLTLCKINPFLRSDSGSGNRNLLKGNLKSFNNAFEAIYKSQTAWYIPDSELRRELRLSVATKQIQAYRIFVDKCEHNHLDRYIKYSAEDLENYFEDLFEGCPKQLNNRNRRQS